MIGIGNVRSLIWVVKDESIVWNVLASYGYQQMEIPDMPEDEVAAYLKSIWDNIGLPEGDYISGSDELDEESVVVEK